MKRRPLLFALALVLALASAAARARAVELNPVQRGLFLQKVEVACESGDADALRALFEWKDTPEDDAARQVQSFKNLLDKAPADRPLFTTPTLLGLADPRVAAIAPQFTGTHQKNGKTYAPTLPVVGFLEIALADGSTPTPERTGSVTHVLKPIGIEPDGSVRIVVFTAIKP